MRTAIPASQTVAKALSAGAAILAMFWFLGLARGQATRLQQLRGHVPPAIATLKPAGQLDPARQLHLAIALPLRNQAALRRLLADLYNPASADFHKFLTAEEFARQFGPTPVDYAAVIEFANAHGLAVTSTHSNRVILDVEGSVGNIQRALHVTLRSYQHPTQARQFFAPDTEPSLDLPVTIAHVSGLDNYSPPQPRFVRKPAFAGQDLPAAAPAAAPNTGSGPGGAYMGNDFRAAYVPGTTLNGAGQTIGLLEFDGYTAGDITYYENAAGLPDVPRTNVLLDGFSGNPTGNGGEVEVSLDIEVALSMAPGQSNLIVYEAGPSGLWHDILNRMATDNLARQLSCSWYIPGGAADAVADGIFQQMAAQGQSFYAASGDSDAFTGLIPFPGDTPYITEVGGTTLSTNTAGGSWASETVWNWNDGVGSGGGISTQYAIPSWQQGISMANNQGSTTMRNTPDVALTANNVYVRADGLDQNVGGTSCAAPLWAAFTALVNEQAAGNGRSPVGFVNPALYSLALGSSYSSDFHDITRGNNFSTNSPTKFSATTGYDLCTGLGSPNGVNLIYALGGPPAPTITTFSPSSGLPGTSVTITGTNFFSVSNVAFNGVSASFTVNSPTQLTASVPNGAATGLLTVTTPGGVATSPGSFVVFGFTPAYGLPGAAITLIGSRFTNAYSVTFNGISAAFTLDASTQITATVPPTATTGPVSVVAPGHTITSGVNFTVLTGTGAPAINSITPPSAAVGATVTINGANFAGVTSVNFNGVAATSFTVNSQSQITATVPVPSGTVNGAITVVTPQGTATSTSTFTTLATLAVFNSASSIPVTSNGFTANGTNVYFNLNYAPTPGTSLTVINNTGLGFINGAFGNLAQGQTVVLNYAGTNYAFVANYYGGTGNDLVLEWANNLPLAWGYNTDGQLGNDSATNSAVPVGTNTADTLSGKTLIALSAGGVHSLALCADGTLASWGDNSYGQLGNGTTTTTTVPTAISTIGTALAGKTVVAIAAGQNHSLALCSDGTIASWGNNASGQLGNNTTTNSFIPVAVTTSGTALAGKTVVAVAAGFGHSLALCSDGTVAAWGENNDGQLGNNSTTNSLVPVAVNTSTALLGRTVVAISAGGFHSLVLCSDGTVATWGNNGSGQLGNGTVSTALTPVAVTTTGTALAGLTVTAISAGQSHCLALCSNGTVTAWGNNIYGQLGNNSTTNSSTAVSVSTAGVLSGKTIQTVQAGYYHSVALCTDGSMAAWGENNDGQLGNGSIVNSSVPVTVNRSSLPGGESVTQIATGASAYHNLAIAAPPSEPQIAVLRPPGTSLTNGGSTIDFGNTTAGVGVQTLLTIQNNGASPLTISDATIDGVNSADFAVTTAPASSLLPAASTTMVVTFSPTSGGPIGRSAAIHLQSNDPTNPTFTVNLYGSTPNTLLATFNSSTSIPLTVANGFSATGSSVVFTLNYAPATGTNLMVVQNTGPGFINGTFSNLAQGQAVTLSYGGVNYSFVANYFGGSGNDLVLQWANNRPVGWGQDTAEQLGNNVFNQFAIPVAVYASGALAGKTVTAVAGGRNHSLALCSDGTLAAWGQNNFGQLGNNSTTDSFAPVAVTTAGTALSGKTVVAISAGQDHNLALCSDGTLVAWALNDNGQLGNNSTAESNIPVAVATSGALCGKTVTAISAGGYHSLALCADGTLVAWGGNFDGQLGNNSTTDTTVPVTVATAGTSLAGRRVVAIAAGLEHSLAACSDGSVSAWGDNTDGQLGNNTTNNCLVAIAVLNTSSLSGKMVVGVSAGFWHSLALCSDGSVSAWGADFYGQLGNGSTTQSNVPVAVSTTGTALNGRSVSSLSAGADHNVALCSDGTTVAWGSGSCGQLGANNNTTSLTAIAVLTPASSLAGKTITAISAGGEHSLACCADGSASAWGDNRYGQLGNNDPLDFPTPVAVTTTGVLAGKTILMMAAGQTHSLALCSDGTLAAWGGNSDGQLGNGTTTNSAIPQAVTTTGVLSGKTVVAVAAGQSHSLALCSDGTVAAWGYGYYGQLGNSATLSSTVPVLVSTSGILSAKTPIAIAAGADHSMALCSDGTVVTWGENNNGQLGIGSLTNSSAPVAINTAGTPLANRTVARIAAGGDHSIALCADGTLATWGDNAYGQLGNGNNLDGLIPVAVTTAATPLAGKTIIGIAAGHDHTVALCSDGTLAAWGGNFDGQLGTNSTSGSALPVAVNNSGVLAGETPIAISAGKDHSLALCTDGTLATWGGNANGELGNSTYTNSLVPVAVNLASLAPGETFIQAVSGPSGLHNLGIIAEPPAPAINVQQPIGTNLVNSVSTVNFGDVAIGGSASQTLTIINNGSAPLSITGVSIGGTNNGDFAVLPPAASPVAVHASTTLTLSFSPASGPALSRNATLQINSNDPVNGAFTVNLTGSTPGVLSAVYNAADNVPLTVPNFSATGITVNFALNFAPSPGTNLTVVKNTGLSFIRGAFGNLAQGQSVILNYGGVNYTFVANYYGGSGNSLVLQWANNAAVAWGQNGYGQLGRNASANSPAPIAVTTTGTPLSGRTILALAAGADHSVAVCADGTLAAWGANKNGQLGDGTNTNAAVPTAVTTTGALAGKSVIAVSAGGGHTLALCSDGTLFAWGSNSDGQLGNGSLNSSTVPVAVSTSGPALSGKSVVAIAAGFEHSLALCSDGTVAAWGSNNYGQLGDNGTARSTVPVAVTTANTALAGKVVVAIAAGNAHSMALCSDGAVVTWGQNSDGQLGNNSTTDSSVAVEVTHSGVLSSRTVTGLTAGGYHSLAFCSDGTAVAWGWDASGQLGNNSTATAEVPFLVTATGTPLAGKTITALAGGSAHSVGLCSDGTLAAWGYNADGELGDNSYANGLTPQAVNTTQLTTVGHFVSAVTGQGAYHTLALVALPPSPEVTTLNATSITATSAMLNGTVSAENNIANVSFDAGPGLSYSVNIPGSPSPLNGSTVTAVSATLNNLTPATTYHFRVDGTNIVGTTYGNDATFTTPNNNAYLSNLALSTGTLSPVFASGTTSYTVSVPYTTPSITVTPTLADGNASVTVNGATVTSGTPSPSLPLTVGSNTVTIVVIAQDGSTTNTYTITATRLSGLESWRQTYFGATANSGSADDTADYSGNGLPNLVKYAFRLDPVTPGASTLLPQAVLSGNTLTITFTEPPGINGISYGAQSSAALLSPIWTSVPDTGFGTTHVFSAPIGNNTTLFLRLTVTEP
jgi:alpha-tubulin suppressor-like RCC1 family protein/subtilase family serine protease